MQYNVIKNAGRIVSDSNYVIKNPFDYRSKWHELFKNNNPIHIELGMGRGAFIIEMAKKHPNINYVGIEINESQMVSAVEKLKSLNLNNIKLINIDAINIDKIFNKEIDTIYLTFCDPWPKKVNEKRRFTHVIYLRLYDKIFKKNKHIILKTDNKGFFAYSLETLSKYWYEFAKVSLDLHHDEEPIENVMTDFEKKYFEEGRPIYYVDAIYQD